MSLIPPPPTFDQAEAAGLDGTLRDMGLTLIMRWNDPLVDKLGVSARSDYTETYWLPVIGPSALLSLRRFTLELDNGDGIGVDLAAFAASMGLSYRVGHESPFSRALKRLGMFGLANFYGSSIHVRTMVPTVPERHVRRFPASLQDRHAEAVAAM